MNKRAQAAMPRPVGKGTSGHSARLGDSRQAEKISPSDHAGSSRLEGLKTFRAESSDDDRQLFGATAPFVISGFFD